MQTVSSLKTGNMYGPHAPSLSYETAMGLKKGELFGYNIKARFQFSPTFVLLLFTDSNGNGFVLARCLNKLSGQLDETLKIMGDEALFTQIQNFYNWSK